MKLIHLFPIYLISTILCFALASTILGDSVATKCSYSVQIPAAKSVFVMLAPTGENECLSQGKEKLEIAKNIRAKYKTSGLFHENDANPLWTVDWFAYQVFVSSDGKHLVRTGPWATDISNEAFSFFSDGKLLKSYTVGDIIRYPSALPHSVSHFEWEKSLQINDDEKTFDVITLEDGEFSFTLENGEIVSKSLPILPSNGGLVDPRFYFSNLPIIIGVIIVALIVLFWIAKKSLRKSR